MINPQDDLTQNSMHWNALHFSCKNNQPEIIKLLINYISEDFQQNLISIVNQYTKEGLTPIMIAIINNYDKCTYELLQSQAVNFQLLYQNKFNILDLTRNYNAINCQQILQHYYQNYYCPNMQNQKNQIVDPFTLAKQNIENFRSIQQDQQYKANNNQKQKTPQYIQDPLYLDQNTQNYKLSQNGIQKIVETIKERGQLGRKILQQCIYQNKNYIDSDFPHNDLSIASNQSQLIKLKLNNSIWLRIQDTVPNYKIELFNKIDPNSIHQSSLGVCYIISFLASLSENPERIKEIFNNKEANIYGVYSLQFYIDGQIQEIVIDDYIPCNQISRQPIFSKPNINSHQDIWVTILEKAWAKTFHNYLASEAMIVEDAMEDFLGAPAKGFWIKHFDQDILFQLAKQWIDNQYLLVATSNDNVEKEIGLVPTHAYTITSVYQQIYNNQKIQLLKIRNPWGYFKFNGLSCYNKSNNLLKQFLDSLTTSNDGSFYMTIQEFYQYFQYVSVCFYRQNYFFNGKELFFSHRKAKYLQFELQEQQDVCIRIHQKQLNRENNGQKCYFKIDFRLFQELDDKQIKQISCNSYNNNTITFIKTLNINEKHTFLQLQPGRYIIRAKLIFNQEYSKKLSYSSVISTYSWLPIQQMNILSKEEGKQVMNKYVASFISNKPSTRYYPQCNGYIKQDWDDLWRLIVCLENKGQQQFQTLIYLFQSKNIKFSQQHNKDNIQIILKPNESQIVVLKPIDYEQEKVIDWRFENSILL